MRLVGYIMQNQFEHYVGVIAFQLRSTVGEPLLVPYMRVNATMDLSFARELLQLEGALLTDIHDLPVTHFNTPLPARTMYGELLPSVWLAEVERVNVMRTHAR